MPSQWCACGCMQVCPCGGREVGWRKRKRMYKRIHKRDRWALRADKWWASVYLQQMVMVQENPDSIGGLDKHIGSWSLIHTLRNGSTTTTPKPSLGPSDSRDNNTDGE